MSGNMVDHLEIEVGLGHDEQWGVAVSYDGRGRVRESRAHILTEVWNWDMDLDTVERARTVCGRTIEDVSRTDKHPAGGDECARCVARWEEMTDREFEAVVREEEG